MEADAGIVTEKLCFVWRVWYHKAAEQNNARAKFLLGFCYWMGQGVAKDYMQAYTWWLLAAAARGYENANKSVALL